MTDRWGKRKRSLPSSRGSEIHRRASQGIPGKWEKAMPRVQSRAIPKYSLTTDGHPGSPQVTSAESAPHARYQRERATWGRVTRDKRDGSTPRPSVSRLAGTDYFRFVDTRMRRIEAALQGVERTKLLGPRRKLKDLLDSVGQMSTVYPHIAEDGEGGVFAEWKAGPERIEIAVDEDGDGYASHSFSGDVIYYVEFQDGSSLPLPALAHLRRVLDRHSTIVTAVNPNWRSLFVG